MSELDEKLKLVESEIRDLKKYRQELIKQKRNLDTSTLPDKLNYIKENSYVFQEESFGYLACINCGLNPNKIIKKWKAMKCSTKWKSFDGITWTELEKGEDIGRGGTNSKIILKNI